MHPDQNGVVARFQLVERGLQPHDIRRRLRRRELAIVHPGVYVDHTGPLTWKQRAWAAVLHAWPAVLADESVLRAAVGRDLLAVDREVVHVAIDESRRFEAPAGVRVRRMREMAKRANWNLGPPRLRLEDAVLNVASRRARPLDAIATLATALGSRRTTVPRLRAALEQRPRLPGRAQLSVVLKDLETGAHSVLEHADLTKVERPHGLPTGRRQVRHVGTLGTGYRDVTLPGMAVIELDGRVHHESVAQRDVDLERDLDIAVAGQAALRLGWGQVFERPCETAVRLALAFSRSGWTGAPTPCSESCVLQRAR